MKGKYAFNVTEQTLTTLADEKYKRFMLPLLPTVEGDRVLGVRIPEIKKLARRLHGSSEATEFLRAAPHRYFDGDNLHAALICRISDPAECIREIDRFLPFVDNWATCDSLRPACLGNDKELLLSAVGRWLGSAHEYTVRFGIEMLMLHYLGGDFKPEFLHTVSGISHTGYYVRMMVAWYFATALAERYEDALPYVENRSLDPWIHAKTISKACDSLRMSAEQKAYLKSLR